MSRRSPRPLLLAGALAATAALTLSSCASNPLSTDDTAAPSGAKATPDKPKVFAGELTANVRRHADKVNVDRVVKVRAEDAQLQHVTLRSKDGPVPGTLIGEGRAWHASALLKTGTKYTLRALAVDDQGLRKRLTRTFQTRKLTLDEQTYPSFIPTDGATVGIAMPVIIRFDVPVSNHALFEKHLHVKTVPEQPGSWHWISDNEVHWRPKHFWKAGTDVTVNADVGSLPAGNGIFGQLDRTETFHIGRSQVTKVNLDTHQLKVVRGGKVIRTIPVTAGREPEFTTRSGVKVIVSKELHTRMNSETIGIDPNSAEGYDLDDVRFAMRLTYSGEYLHAAPWSVASQGHANVSHGCTGMSTANAEWLYNNSLIGDPVIFTGTNKPMTLTNGYGDWNESFAVYKRGSAL